MYDDVSLPELLKKQVSLYPKMQISDAVKLLYQNEFAGGHIIENEKSSEDALRRECLALEDTAEKANGARFEDIGNGLCRLHLQGLKDTGVSLSTVNRFFVDTAHSVCGSIRSFENKLEVLRTCCRQKELPFCESELNEYLCRYQSRGYPPVGHSEEFKDAYRPAYRVVKSVYRDYFEIFRRIDSLLASKDRIVVAIDGNCGSGKSTLASLIARVYDCNLFHMDHYFLRPEQKTESRLKEAGGNVDYERFLKEIIGGLISRKGFWYRIYDCKNRTLGRPVPIAPQKISVIEGSYSMHPALSGHYDLTVFLRIGEEEQQNRILKRNGAFMLKRFLDEWIPLENRYFQELSVEKRCDLVFSG